MYIIFENNFQYKDNIMKKLVFIFAVLCFILAGNFAASAKELCIAVSIVPQARFAKEVAGEKAKVLCIIPEGGSPAAYSPSPKEMAALRDADIYFTIGVASEQRNILGQLPERLAVVPLHEKVAAVYPDLHIGSSRDPHIWLSPKRAELMVRIMAEEISRLDPENASYYTENAEKYIAKIRRADSEAREILANVRQKTFMVFHPAFGYLADEYGLTMYALEKHGKEAGARHLQEMTDIAKQNGVKVIFYQKEISGRQVEAFAREIGGKAVRLNPLAYDYTENLLELAKAMQESM